MWISPGSQWQKRYVGWPALKKLEYMDQLMREIRERPPLVISRARVEPLSRLRKTLRTYYRQRREYYQMDYPNFYDGDLRNLFSDAPEFNQNLSASRFLVQVRKAVRRDVARWTGEYQYVIDQVLHDIIARCRELKLRLVRSEEQTKSDFTILLTVQTMNYLHSGRHRVTKRLTAWQVIVLRTGGRGF